MVMVLPASQFFGSQLIGTTPLLLEACCGSPPKPRAGRHAPSEAPQAAPVAVVQAGFRVVASLACSPPRPACSNRSTTHASAVRQLEACLTRTRRRPRRQGRGGGRGGDSDSEEDDFWGGGWDDGGAHGPGGGGGPSGGGDGYSAGDFWGQPAWNRVAVEATWLWQLVCLGSLAHAAHFVLTGGDSSHASGAGRRALEAGQAAVS